jgi:hypothetical protein
MSRDERWRALGEGQLPRGVLRDLREQRVVGHLRIAGPQSKRGYGSSSARNPLSFWCALEESNLWPSDS